MSVEDTEVLALRTHDGDSVEESEKDNVTERDAVGVVENVGERVGDSHVIDLTDIVASFERERVIDPVAEKLPDSSSVKDARDGELDAVSEGEAEISFESESELLGDLETLPEMELLSDKVLLFDSDG